MEYKGRDALRSRLKTVCEKNAAKSTKVKEYMATCKRIYGIPESAISNYLYNIEDIENINDDLLGPVAETVLGEKVVAEYIDSASYKGYKYEEISVLDEFHPVIQVAPDQWITFIDCDDLIVLYDSGKIRYNPETQRPMRRTRSGNTEVYRFYKNDKAIAEMADALRRDLFIPNTITINLLKSGFEGNLEENYNEASATISFRSIDHFDLLDGYHRFLALRRVKLLDSSFEFTMELRITNFTLDKARQFIFQEDQKTKMTKVQSASYNTNDIANQVVGYLKQKFPDLIARNGGIIDEALLARAINDIYMGKNVPRVKSEQVKFRNEIANELEGKLSDYVNANPELIDQAWDKDRIAVFIWCCKDYKGDNLNEYINNFYDNKGDSKFFVNSARKGAVVNVKELESRR